jgi:hypothetical protein
MECIIVVAVMVLLSLMTSHEIVLLEMMFMRAAPWWAVRHESAALVDLFSSVEC